MKSVTFKKKTKNLLSLALQSSSLEMMAREMFCNKQMYPLGTIHIIDPQAKREEIEKHRLEKSCKKTSISTSLSGFKINAIADVYLGKVLHIFWHSSFISAAVPQKVVIHREFSQASAVVDTNWKIQWTMETIKKLHFNTKLCSLKKKYSYSMM